MPDITQVEPLIEKKLVSMGFDLYELKFIKAGTHSIVRIFIDKEGGVTIKDCEEASHEISILLDVENFYNKKHTLEVSSPGIDRLLITEKDFKRVIGENIKLRLKDPIKKNSSLKGKLLECVDGSLTIDIKKEIKKIHVSTILSGKIEITFK